MGPSEPPRHNPGVFPVLLRQKCSESISRNYFYFGLRRMSKLEISRFFVLRSNRCRPGKLGLHESTVGAWLPWEENLAPPWLGGGLGSLKETSVCTHLLHPSSSSVLPDDALVLAVRRKSRDLPSCPCVLVL